jgi:proteasome lid subunit RPN8/RPN11
MSTVDKKITSVYKEVTLEDKVKLIISKELQAEVANLHRRVGDIEWSGILLYEVVEGNIKNPSSLVLKANRIYPMDIGSSTYTEYEFTEEVMDMYDHIEGAEEMKIGHIHSHHNMSCFFSGTDNSELHDNAPNHNFYLSLIVNHKMINCAKVAVVGKRKSKGSVVEIQGFDGPDKIKFVDTEEEVLLLMDCVLEYESNVENWFNDRVDALFEKNRQAAAKRVTYVAPFNKTPLGPVYTNRSWNDDPYAEFADGGFGQLDIFDQPLYNKPNKEEVIDSMNTRTFLIKLLNLDSKSDKALYQTLKAVEESLIGTSSDFYLDALEMQMDQIFYDVFLRYSTKDDVSKVSKIAVNILEPFKATFDIVEELIEMFELYQIEEVEDSWEKLNK